MSKYYECHITLFGNKEEIKAIVEDEGWKFSAIDGDPVLGGGVHCYATHHYGKHYEEGSVVNLMNFKATIFKNRGLQVLRQKVEYVVYDTKWKVA